MPNTAPIAFDSGFRSRLGAGLAVSLFAHLAFAIALTGGWWSGATEQGSIVSALPPPEPEQAVVRPGIERSRAVTINWLGFETPTEHVATPADTDQAALSPDTPGLPEIPPGPSVAFDPSPGPAPEPVEAKSEPEPEIEPKRDNADRPVAPEAKPVEVPVEPAPSQSPGDPGDGGAAAPAPLTPEPQGPGVAAPLLEIVKRALEAARAASDSRPEPTPADSAPPTPATSSPEGPPAPGGGSPTAQPDALPSEKEAGATSREQPVDWAPGRPAAAQGLDITTVDPRWTIATRLSALPRNPVVRIDFGKDGRVRKAEFLPGQDTGYRDVDGPLLDALYRWTAKGDALADLPADQPDAVVSLRFRIILMPSRGTVHRPSKGR